MYLLNVGAYFTNGMTKIGAIVENIYVQEIINIAFLFLSVLIFYIDLFIPFFAENFGFLI